MYEFTWRVFKETGNVDIYLLLKELEKEKHMINI
ncbi:TPA: YqzL family protein, partial [Streptococcus pyogenes]|nr:YqzL family protein [Streptococcus pyogenes]